MYFLSYFVVKGINCFGITCLFNYLIKAFKIASSMPMGSNFNPIQPASDLYFIFFVLGFNVSVTLFQSYCDGAIMLIIHFISVDQMMSQSSR